MAVYLRFSQAAGSVVNAVAVTVLTGTSLLAVFSGVHAQEPGASTDAAEQFNSIAEGEAKGFIVFYADDAANPFQMASQPLLNWTNPVSGSIRGRVYLWTHGGIPSMIGSIYKYDEQSHVSSEMHALSPRPITGKSGQGVSWKVDQASIEFKTLPNGGSPGASRAARLAQMRDLARRFNASRSDPDKNNWDLRLLGRPLYRYPETTVNGADGALFAFVQGTNPDVILIIESEAASGATWKYALARMHRNELHVNLDHMPIQQFPALTIQDLSTKVQPYTVFRTFLTQPQQ